MDTPSKTSFPNGKREFESYDGIWTILQECDMIINYGLNCIIDSIVEYLPIIAVRFGDMISIKRHNEQHKSILTVNQQQRFQIVKCDGSINRRQVVHYGQNFLLKSCNDNNKYIQRHKFKNDDRKTVHKTVRFSLGMVDIDLNSKYKQTVQFDIADKKVMGKVVKYDKSKIGLTFGGNYEIKTSQDHLNPYNNFRTWLTVRGYNHDCVVSWFQSDEQLIIDTCYQ